MNSSLTDTVKLVYACEHTPFGVEKLRQEGETVLYRARDKLAVLGENGRDAIWVRSVGGGERIIIEGSAPKFLTGQNLFGTDDLQLVSEVLLERVTRILEIKPNAAAWRAVMAGETRVQRHDITTHADLDDQYEVRLALRAFALLLVFSGCQCTVYPDETVQIGTATSRWLFKIYNKGLQMLVNPPRARLREAWLLSAFAETLLRFELTLRSDWLKDNALDTVAAWSPKVSRRLLRRWIRRVTAGAVPLIKAKPPLDELKTLDNLILQLHRLGVLLEPFGSARWFSDHRRSIIANTGFDLRVPSFAQAAAQATYDLEHVRDRVEFGQPEWAVRNGLIPVRKTGARKELRRVVAA